MPLKMVAQFSKCIERQKTPFAFVADVLFFQSPRVWVRDINRVQAYLERGIDVGSWRIANHPGILQVEIKLRHKPVIRVYIFLLDNNSVSKIYSQARIFNFVLLFFLVALCQENELLP